MFTFEIFSPLLLIAPIALAVFERCSESGVKSLWTQSDLSSKFGFALFTVYFVLVVSVGYGGMIQCHQGMTESQAFNSIYFIPGLLFAVVSFPQESANAIAAFINKKAVRVFIFVLSWLLIAELARRVIFWGCW